MTNLLNLVDINIQGLKKFPEQYTDIKLGMNAYREIEMGFSTPERELELQKFLKDIKAMYKLMEVTEANDPMDFVTTLDSCIRAEDLDWILD